MASSVWLLVATLASVVTEPTRFSADPEHDTIIGGEPTGPGEFDGVVAVMTITGGLCTGTMVTPKLVLTAAHCIEAVEQATDVFVAFGTRIAVGAETAHVTDFGTHPSFCSDQEKCPSDIFDYGYLVIDGTFHDDAPFMAPIIDQAEWDTVMRVGSTVMLVGFGIDPDHELTGPGVKRKVETTITRLSPLGYEFRAGGESHDSCAGDSGGPAFIQLPSGEWRLAGITSRGSEPCGSGGFYGVPYPALAWVAEETGTNLCGDACSSCDCLDVSPPVDEGCGCRSEGEPQAIVLAWLVAVLALHRRGTSSPITEARPRDPRSGRAAA